MLIPKLIALQRKFKKIKKTLNNLPLPKIISMETFQKNNPRFFNDKILIKKQISFRKNYYIVNKFKKENLSYTQEGILNALNKYLNLIAMSLERNEKQPLTFLQKSKNNFHHLYIGAKSDSIKTDSGGWETKSKRAKYLEKSPGLNNPFKSLSELYNGTLEQKYYTESNRRIGTIRSEEVKKPRESIELPPPSKCRLSCPLPPPEFTPEETQEYKSTYQSPFLKYSNQPELFLPHNNKKTASMCDSLAPRLNLNPQTWTKKTFALETTELTSAKTYPFILRNYKSQMYLPSVGEPPKMKAVLYEPGTSSFNYSEVNIPTHIYKDEVLVQVVYSGVCDTDLLISERVLRKEKSPLILGQEISGRVYAAGSNVHHVKTDDHVAIDPFTACLVCRYCTRGDYYSCLNEGYTNCTGIGKDGGWAEFVVVKKSQTHKLPDSLGMDRAVLIQPLSKILNALSKLNLSHDKDILIQGGGMTGFLWALALHFKGYRNVFVSDTSEKRRQQFRNLNLNYPSVDVEEIEKYSADVIIECSGSESSLEKCVRAANPNGQILFFKEPNPGAGLRLIPYDLVKKEIKILGSRGNAFCFSNAVDLAATMGYKYLNFNKLGIKVFKLKEYEQAFHLIQSGEVEKVIFKIGN